MKEIILTQGKIAIIDDDDYERVSNHKWSALKDKKKFYAVTTIKIDGIYKKIKLHRFIMNLNDPKIFVDHKDRDGLNNTRLNLRICTISENNSNRVSANKTSKFLGVHLSGNKWRASINKNGKYYHLGFYDNEIDAAKAYNIKAHEIHGEFANLNKFE